MPLYNGGRIGSNNKPFTGGDPNYSNVSLLLNGNGTNGSTTFTDSSSNNHTITANGNAQISTAQSKFGGASMYFDGSGDYLVLPDDQNSFYFGTSDFTLECWIYPTGSVIGNLFSQRGSGMSWRYRGDNQGIDFFYANGSSAFSTSNSSVPLNTWSHVALTRNGNTFTIWVNGQSSATNTITASMDYAIPRIGTSIIYPGEAFQGYIDDFRITKGVARYTSNFTSPTAELPGQESGTFASGLWTLKEQCVAIRKELWPGLILPIVTDGLVLNLDAGDSNSYPGSGTTWTDLSGNGNNGTLNGPTYSSNNGGYFDFDGVNDYVSFTSTSLNLFPVSFSFWATAGGEVINKYTPSSFNGYRISLTTSGVSAYYFRSNSSYTNNYDNNYGNISANTFYHVVVVVDNSGIKFYVNSQLVGSNGWVGTPGVITTTEPFELGFYTQYRTGNIAQVSVYNKALTPTEITQNFNALKGRYGL